MLKFISWILFLVIALVIAALSIANRETVTFSLDPLPFAFDLPLFGLLLAAGFSVNQALVIIVCVAVVAMGFGLYALQAGWSEIGQFIAFMGLFTVYFGVMMRCWSKGCLFARSLNPFSHERRAGAERRQIPLKASWVGKPRRVQGFDRRQIPGHLVETDKARRNDKERVDSRMQ